MPESLLDRAIYSYADVDRLVGLRSGTARRWLEGYERLGRFYDPVLRPEPAGTDRRCGARGLTIEHPWASASSRRSGRTDVLHPGTRDLRDVPVGTPDLGWMPVLARLHLVLVTRDRRIRTRPAELRAYWEFGIRSVWIGAKQDPGPRDQLELFLAHEERLQREILKRGAGRWAPSSTTGARNGRFRQRGSSGRARKKTVSRKPGNRGINYSLNVPRDFARL